jgi:hypothetical protein
MWNYFHRPVIDIQKNVQNLWMVFVFLVAYRGMQISRSFVTKKKTMKNLSRLTFLTLLIAFFFVSTPSFSMKRIDPVGKVSTETNLLANRAGEINPDKVGLTRKQKKDSRRDARTAKSAIRSNGGVIYISGATILLIVLLIILL